MQDVIAGALYWSQIDKIVYGARDEKEAGLFSCQPYHPSTLVVNGIKKEDCQKILKEFFKLKENQLYKTSLITSIDLFKLKPLMCVFT